MKDANTIGQMHNNNKRLDEIKADNEERRIHLNNFACIFNNTPELLIQETTDEQGNANGNVQTVGAVA